jgi:sulfoxide reductase heme-binding subunit YedZ
MGVEPIKAMEHAIGILGLQVLIASLCVTPLRTYARINLFKFRRALGLIAFFYIVLHLLVWLLLDVRIASQIIADLYKRPYITIGMAGLLLLIPLAITSNRYSIRKLGAIIRVSGVRVPAPPCPKERTKHADQPGGCGGSTV